MLGNSFESVGQNGIGTEFEGTLEYQPAKAYVIGGVNPHGSGVTIVSATLKDKYSSQHKQTALAVAKTLQFKKANIGPLADQWKERISGTRLTYMSSYSPGGGTGGYSNESVIDLCPQSYFNYSTINHMSIDVGSTAYNNRIRAGAGQWKIAGNHSGQAVLQLNFSSSEVYEYVLSRDGDKTFLNGDRYFRTRTGENAPNCNDLFHDDLLIPDALRSSQTKQVHTWL